MKISMNVISLSRLNHIIYKAINRHEFLAKKGSEELLKFNLKIFSF